MAPPRKADCGFFLATEQLPHDAHISRSQLTSILLVDDEDEDSSTPPSSPTGPTIARRHKFDDEEDDSDVISQPMYKAEVKG